MKRIRIIGLCLVAVFAMGAVIVASASAEAPEYGRCLAHTGGAWATNTCTKPKTSGTTEKYEWYPASGKAANGEEKPIAKPKFKSASVAEKLIQLEGTGEAQGKVRTKVICTGQTSEGEIVGPKEAIATHVEFTGCESGGIECAQGTGPKGLIKVSDLKGDLGVEKWGEKEGKEVSSLTKLANRFEPKSGSEFFPEFTKFTCGGLTVQVKGHVIFPLSTDKMLKSAVVKFAGPSGSQKPECFLKVFTEKKCTEATEEVLESKFETIKLVPFEESSQTLTTTQTNEEPLEANSVI
jgi:hypothetical protein